MIRRQIPNVLTLSNLLCGILAIYFLYDLECSTIPILPSLLIIAGAVFDFFDGFTARALKVSSPIGKELDSLADVVTFGLAPSLITVELLKSQASFADSSSLICLIPLFMALMSAYRLAKFNLDERQSTSFIGLPTPANALLWLSLPLLVHLSENKIHLWGLYSEQIYAAITAFLTNPYFICLTSLVMAGLLVSELKMFALKFKNFTWQDNKVKFIFLISCLVLLFVLNCFAIPFIVLLYIIISIITNTFKR